MTVHNDDVGRLEAEKDGQMRNSNAERYEFMELPPVGRFPIYPHTGVVHKYMRDNYAKRFPELEQLVQEPLDYARTVKVSLNPSHLFLPLRLSLSLFFYFSLSLLVCLCVPLLGCLFLSLITCLSVLLSEFLPVCVSLCVSLCVSRGGFPPRLSVCLILSVLFCLCICLSAPSCRSVSPSLLPPPPLAVTIFVSLS